MRKVRCDFRGKPLSPIWRFRVNVPEEVLFVPGEERQPGLIRGRGSGGFV